MLWLEVKCVEQVSDKLQPSIELNMNSDFEDESSNLISFEFRVIMNLKIWKLFNQVPTPLFEMYVSEFLTIFLIHCILEYF